MDVTKQNNAQGIVLMVLSMGAFALADALVKLATPFLSPAQTMFFLIGGGLVLFSMMAIMRGERLIDRRVFLPVLLLRYLSEVTGLGSMILALTYVQLSTVGAITQATPILVAVGAVLFLDEKVSWRRWSSIAMGFVGVLLIIQPGTEGFDIAVLWAVVSMVALSVRDLITRLTPKDMASTSLATYTMVAALPFAVGWVLFNGESLIPADTDWLIAIPMVSLGSVGYMMLIAAIRMAEVSVVTPFRYSRLIFVMVLGAFVFDERPGAMMLIGAMLIIVSGIYLVWREQWVKRDLNR